MKKQVLFTLAAAVSISSYAQHGRSLATAPTKTFSHAVKPLAKTTGVGDTLILTNIDAMDTLTILSYNGGGYTSGNNNYGDKGFAERYDFNPNDSLLKVIGVVTYFTGNYNAATSNTVTLKTYAQGSSQRFGGIVYNGFPAATLAQRSVSLKSLGINTSGADTIKAFLFTTPTAPLADSFFVGYEIGYNAANLAGDTIGLVYTRDGNRNSWTAQISGSDTIINVQNAVMWSDGSWNDEYWVNSGMAHDYYIMPIVIVNSVISSVSGVTKNNLEFFGAYPNPASYNTNIKIALRKALDVTITITDLNGRAIKSLRKNLSSGQHIIPVETADLANGNYLYMVRTSEGDGIASMFTIAK